MKLISGLIALAVTVGCGQTPTSETKDITNIEYMDRIGHDRFLVHCDDGSTERRTSDEIAARRVCDYDSAISNVFRLKQVDTHVQIFSRDTGKLLQNWYKHDRVKIFRNYIVLVDSEGEALVFKYENGQKKTIVEKWYDVVRFEINENYVALLDSKRILEAWRLSDGTKIIKNWKNVVKAGFRMDFIVLLDDEDKKNLEIYDINGTEIFKKTGVTSFDIQRGFTVTYRTTDGRTYTQDMRNYLDLN